MRKIKLLATVTALALVISLIGCSTPNSSGNTNNSSSSSGNNNSGSGDGGNGNGSGDAGTGAGTGTGTDGGSGTGTESGGGNGTGGGSTVNPTLQYEWISIRGESTSKIDNSQTYRDYNSTSDYSYSYYTDSLDYKRICISAYSDEIITSRGTEWEDSTITNQTSKSINTCVKDGTGYISTTDGYIQSGDTWELNSRQTSTRCETTNGYTLTTKTYSKNGNNWELASTTVYSYELLSKENDVEKYKMTVSSTSSFYYIYEYKNDILIKQTIYANDKKSSEIIYQQPNNQVIKDRIPDYTLTTTKNYDTNGNCVSESYQTLEDVILNEAQNTLIIKTGNTTNTNSNYSYSIITYKKMQIPFSQQ